MIWYKIHYVQETLETQRIFGEVAQADSPRVIELMTEVMIELTGWRSWEVVTFCTQGAIQSIEGVGEQRSCREVRKWVMWETQSEDGCQWGASGQLGQGRCWALSIILHGEPELYETQEEESRFYSCDGRVPISFKEYVFMWPSRPHISWTSLSLLCFLPCSLCPSHWLICSSLNATGPFHMLWFCLPIISALLMSISTPPPSH